MFKKILSASLCTIMLLAIMAGAIQTQESGVAPQSINVVNAASTGKAPKYIFMFIGDGMSHVQVNSAQVYEGNNTYGEVNTRNLNFSKFPVAGYATTHDSTSFAPDSASTATSLSSGIKTHSGVIGLGADKTTKPKAITELLKEQKDMKVGIVSTVTINHATPAAYYSHVASRSNYYDIAMQMADSGFDYFAGGSISQPTGKDKDQKDAYEVLKDKGYSIVDTKEDIMALNNKSGKTYAVSPVLQDSGAMPYAIDNKKGDLTLADFVKKGIDVLDNEKGFFLMAESGKIDWSGHANDAKSNIHDVLSLESAVQVALDFAKKYPEDTLIVVTGDHETGGMTIGYASTGYDTAFNILDHQKMSYVAFDELMGGLKKKTPNMTFEQVMPIITENFGLVLPNSGEAKSEKNSALVLSELELKKLKDGFAESMKSESERIKSEETELLYGGYDPLSVTLTHILNNKAGIGWTSYSHTGTPVPVYAYGQGAEVFSGSYDNTDVFHKLIQVTKIKK
ncbi:alkaline phosphatase III [Gottschalkia acidurici 9a]|uniref:Alkaline phosphatase III n=1 Tax=Gottschalkia acidurici (strain ATCC 7906 / DSM 604 / BCRC 14475 / CIP 104303 / KCTC 5404 / NCIMB 10678 / 9a) TaxID=1128398 RepID=K0AWZ3_GOTA9|nr:alkaline phosphatase [Gottschalkia acidurici]AFS77297.1 alkaline phosphatase III [Gottschalkia acidurici 9a]